MFGGFNISSYICGVKYKIVNMTLLSNHSLSGNVVDAIYDTAKTIMPQNSNVILFGSRARGDNTEDSDWDLLILLDKEKADILDHDKYTYPFWELGWKTNSMIHPILYTKRDWEKRKGDNFYENIQNEGIVIC